jgi:hypothetical protein
VIRPVCFRQGKNLSENLRQTLRSIPWNSHHVADVAEVKFCLPSDSFFLMAETQLPASGFLLLYSARNAVIGFTRVARLAGKKQARSAAIASIKLALMSAKGSVGFT